jgi:hypothetical protein
VRACAGEEQIGLTCEEHSDGGRRVVRSYDELWISRLE